MDAGDEIERAGQDGRSRWLRFIRCDVQRFDAGHHGVRAPSTP